MKKQLHFFLLFTLIITGIFSFTHPIIGQIRDGNFVEEHDSVQFFRAKHFDEMRQFADGSYPDIWQEFQKSRETIDQKTLVSAANWISLGPNTMDSLAGRMTCHAFNPLNSRTLLSGSSSGGLWKTTDGGDHWFPVTDALPSIRISAVAYNPSDTNHIIIGTGFFQNTSFTLAPGIGLFESFDGGSTWLPSNLEFAFSEGVAISKIVWDQSNTERIYVGSSIGVWTSSDMGQTWTNTLSGKISDLEIVKATPERLFAAIHSRGIYRSDNHGDDWTLLTNGLPSNNIHRIDIGISDSAPGFALASIVEPVSFGLNGLYKTSNGGDSWELIPNPPNYLCNSNCLGWFVNLVEVSPLDTNNIILAGPRLYRTINGGQTWEWRDYYSNGVGGTNYGLAFVDNWDAGYDPTNPGTVYVFNDGGVQKSTDNGFYWQKASNGLNTGQFYVIASYPQDTNLMLGGIQDHGFHYLDNSNGNKNWKFWYIGDGCFVSFDPNNPLRGFGDNLFAFHYRSNNVTGGSSSINNFNLGITNASSIPFHFVTVHHPTESNVLYTANNSNIFRSTNGIIWIDIADISNVRKLAISPANPSTVYAASYTQAGTWSFYSSHDGGDNWSQTANSPGWRVTDVEGDPVVHGTVYATRNSAFMGNPHVYKSIDHGENWTAISTGLPDVPTWTITVNPFNSHVIYVGTDLGVYISEDEGQSWNEYNDNLPPYYVMDMHYHPLDSTLRIATLGRGVWKTKSISNNITSASDLNLESTLFEVFPNPFSTVMDVKIDLMETTLMRLSILNVLGQEIKLLFEGKGIRGQQAYNWDGLNKMGKYSAKGIYFVKLEIGGKKMVKQIVLQ